MPYKSAAQRRFFHSPGAAQKGISPSTVKEFDSASKGLKLPERAPTASRIKRVIHAAITGVRKFEF